MNQQDKNPVNPNQVEEESDNDNDKKPKLFDPDDNNDEDDGNDGDEGEYLEDNIQDIFIKPKVINQFKTGFSLSNPFLNTR